MDTRRDVRRLPALDGLRGIAALVVVVHHGLLTAPALAGYYFGVHPRSGPLWAQLMTFSPVHLAWAGTEAVYIFFVLSGLVLVLPAARRVATPWRSYYPQRILRLLLPIAGAVVLSYLLLRLGDRTVHPWRSPWMNYHAETVTLRDTLKDALVVYGSASTNSALWSLQWEMFFSLALPGFVLALLRLRLPLTIQLAVVAAGLEVSLLGHFTVGFYLGIFALGVVLAVHVDLVQRWGERLGHRRAAHQTMVLAGTLLLLLSKWLLAPLGHGSNIGVLGSLAGATLVVSLFVGWPPAVAAGTRKRIAWVGTRSFSLYLVHEPIVVTTSVLLGRHTNPVLVLLIAMPLSLVVASGFFRVVERPSHRLSRWTGSLLMPAQSRPARSSLAPSR